MKLVMMILEKNLTLLKKVKSTLLMKAMHKKIYLRGTKILIIMLNHKKYQWDRMISTM